MHRRLHPQRKGFTLVEVMIATTIGVVGLSVAAGFIITASRLVYDSSKRMELNSKVRIFTDRFAKETIDANAFYVLQDFGALDGYADLIGENSESAAINKPVPSNESGDCVLLEYRDDPTDRSAITRLRVYYRDTQDIDAGAPIRIIDVPIASSMQHNSLNSIVNSSIPDLTLNHNTHPTLVHYQVFGIIPADSDDVQPIFFNHGGRAVSVNFRMQTTGTDTGPSKRSASAYNFTISPRR